MGSSANWEGKGFFESSWLSLQVWVGSL